MNAGLMLLAAVVHVGGMSESPYGTRTAETIVREGLGDYTVLFVGPWTGAKVRAVGDYCRAHRMKFVMDEVVSRRQRTIRGTYGKLAADSLAAAREYADVLDGSLLLCEFGGLMFNWPESTVAQAATKPPPAKTFAEAESNTVDCMRRTIAFAETNGVPRPYVCIEPTGGAMPFALRAGIDRVDLEVIYGEDLERRYAGTLGAVRAYGQRTFGVDMAMVWYGGNQHDTLWEARWRNSLFHAFIRGANPIYTEHGLMNYQALGKDYDERHPDVVRFRKAVGELARWAKAHPRPDGQPRAALAAVQGRFDGFVGGWQTHLWGQRLDEAWRITDEDRAWELFDGLYRRRQWECRDKWGNADYSGNPPLGTADILPYDASDAAFANYRTLVFLGRNSMDDVLYGKLVRFVRNGGTLLLSACHLGTANEPGATFVPYNGGDWSELTGLKAEPGRETRMPYGLKFKANPPCGCNFPLWSANCDPKFTDGGFRMPVVENVGAEVLAVASDRFVDETFKAEMQPVLYSHKIGKGMVVFLPSLDSPGAPGVRPLYSFLLASAAEGTDAWPKVECSDRVRWSVYGDEKLYLLNTEEARAEEAVVWISKNSPELRIRLAAGEIREIDLKSAGIGLPCLQNPTADSVEVAWSVSGLSYGAVEIADNPEMRGARRFAAPQTGLQRPERRLVRVKLANLPRKPLWYRTITTPVVEYVDCYTFKLGEPVKGDVCRLDLPRADGSSHFAVINDTHDFREPVKRVFEKVGALDPALLVWNGDIVGSLESEDEAVRTVIEPVGAEGYAAARPCLYTKGNHEYRGTWSQHLDSVMPTGNAAIRCGDVAIVTLDTGEPIPDDDPAWHGHAAFGPLFAEQTKWLEEALKRPDIASAPFLVAVCHVPIADEKGDIVNGLEGWAKLLDEAGAQLVIAGHTHIPRYDAPSGGRRWAQIVGGGPILGEFEGDKGHMDLPDFFPTVIDVDVRDGRLEVEMHDLWRRRNFGRYSFSSRSI